MCLFGFIYIDPQKISVKIPVIEPLNFLIFSDSLEQSGCTSLTGLLVLFCQEKRTVTNNITKFKNDLFLIAIFH